MVKRLFVSILIVTLLTAWKLGKAPSGGTGNDLLANTGQPIYSTGTTPILVQ